MTAVFFLILNEKKKARIIPAMDILIRLSYLEGRVTGVGGGAALLFTVHSSEPVDSHNWARPKLGARSCT